MTPQEIFDTVAIHLLNQKQKSANSDGDCFYRSPYGLRCAVGAILPDDCYNPKMEGRVASHLYQFSNVPQYIIDNSLLLEHLQTIHDEYEPEFWLEALYEFVNNEAAQENLEYKLSTAVLDKFNKK